MNSCFLRFRRPLWQGYVNTYPLPAFFCDACLGNDDDYVCFESIFFSSPFFLELPRLLGFFVNPFFSTLTGPGSGGIPFLTVRFLPSAAWRLVGCTRRTARGSYMFVFAPRRTPSHGFWLWAAWRRLPVISKASDARD